jgi:hypothetical protein
LLDSLLQERCLAIQVLVILEQGHRLELREVVIQVLELLGATLDSLDSLDSLEEDTPGSSLVKELLGEDTQGHLAHLAPLVPLVATQEQVLQVEDIQALVPREAATLVQEVLHRELPKVAILEVLQVATQEVHLEATQARHLQASKVPILEQLHLRLSTLRLSSGSEQWTRITLDRLMPRSSDRLLPTGMEACSVRRLAGP